MRNAHRGGLKKSCFFASGGLSPGTRHCREIVEERVCDYEIVQVEAYGADNDGGAEEDEYCGENICFIWTINKIQQETQAVVFHHYLFSCNVHLLLKSLL